MFTLTRDERNHYEHELLTASFIKQCYKLKCKQLTPEKLYALCQLTWWSPANYYTPAKLQALWTLWNIRDEIPKVKNIINLKEYGFPKIITNYEIENIGIVNFYKAYRIIAYKWIKDNFDNLNILTKKAACLESDDDALFIIKSIETLPYIPKPNNKTGASPSENMLTPLFACLDPRLRFPIINKADHVKVLHGKLGITKLTLTDKYLTLVNLINQMGIKDCMMLDSVSDHIARMPIKKMPKEPLKPGIESPLGIKDAGDIEVLLNNRKIIFTHLHNKMTNKLKELCQYNNYKVTEGTKEPYKYDALIHNFNSKGRDLLIEVKSSSERACIRLAVGQLFDYRRSLIRRAVTDLSILLPEKPKKPEMDFLNYIGVNILWFKDNKMTMIQSNFGFRLSTGH
jgi:hypothetical protein